MSNYSAEVYWEFSDIVYDDAYLKENTPILIKGQEYRVITSVDDSKTGLQAMAVVSKSDWDQMKADSSFQPNITFVSRGTKDGQDWLTNVKDLSTGTRYDSLIEVEKNDYLGKDYADSIRENNQFYVYEKWVNDTLKSKKYGRGTNNYDFTGHSLGGALAQFMGVLKGKETITYAAALPYFLLPKSLQKKIDNGEFDHLITDYRHHDDVVPYLPALFKRIGKSYYIQTGIRGMILAHLSESFTSFFNSDGSVRIFYDVKALKGHSKLFAAMSKEVSDIYRDIERFEMQQEQEMNKFLKSVQANQNGGEYSELTTADIEEIFQMNAPYFENGKPRCYNKLTSNELKSKLKKVEKQVSLLGKALKESADNAAEEDTNQANSFKLNMKGFR